MRFGPVPVAAAAGAILAHTVAQPTGTLRKGHRLTPADIAALSAAGVAEVVAAVLEPGDVHEDAAARRLATALAGSGVRVEAPATGRSNLFADSAGVMVVDRARVDALNGIDPGITLATLPEYATVEAGRMVATVKIIPFAVPEAAVAAAERAIAARGPLLSVHRYRITRVGVVSSQLPSLKPSVIDKTLRVMADRLAASGAAIVADRRVGHDEMAVAGAIRAAIDADGAELVVVFGASAVVDADDVIPAAIRDAGGKVEHFGMPVDPGNLLLVGRVGATIVIGAPGCARSPKENGFDWILARMLAGIPVSGRDIVGLGVGGLLMDIVSRPRPRVQPIEADRPAGRSIAAVVLAAGRSSRMGGPNKLVATLGGKPLVRLAAEAALGSKASSVVVVTGDRAEAVTSALDGLSVRFVHNPDFADGLSTSLKAGLNAVPAEAEAVIVLLADMPLISAELVDRLIAAYDPAAGALIVVPTYQGRRGNPVLWSRRFMADLARVSGDVGARNVIADYPEAVVELELGAAVALDLDTPEALAAAGGALPPA